VSGSGGSRSCSHNPAGREPGGAGGRGAAGGAAIDPLITSFFRFNSFLGETVCAAHSHAASQPTTGSIGFITFDPGIQPRTYGGIEWMY
jgi:hypothetical protein